MRKLVLLHLPANAILLWLAYEWLGVGESTTMHLVVSAFGALAILALACWLYGATFVYFRSGNPRIAPRHLAALVGAVLGVILLYAALAWAADATNQPAFRLASWLTLHFRKPVKPATISRIVQGFFWIVRWGVLPVLLFVLVTRIRNWRYWLVVPALLLAGLQLPFVLLRWIPAFDSFAMQFASFTVRIVVAYGLFVAASLMLAFVSARRHTPEA
jgi:hypothetical protein